MYELTNEQRKCFALCPVSENWSRAEIKASPYDDFKTFAYIENNVIVKCIITGSNTYCEYELSEQLSDDGKFLLPKTAKGKPVLLSSSNLLKRNGTGMCLSYRDRYVTLYSVPSNCSYYSNTYINSDIVDINSFFDWVNAWCNETTPEDIADVEAFSKKKREHVKFSEGDIFRFKIDRHRYGYGRIILDYDKMRKRKQIFWDILMSKPLVCSVYHIITDRTDVTVDELKELKSLPSTIIADNNIYYGEYQIIGNIPIGENEDYPIMYGNSIRFGEKAVCLQHGTAYRKIENSTALHGGFTNNGVSFSLNFVSDVLLRCIETNSNKPYWDEHYQHVTNRDLRNPKFEDIRKEISAQMNVTL